MKNVNLAVVYYSSTGTNYKMAQAAADAAKELGSEVRVLKVPELAPEEAIASNAGWKAHYEATKDVPTATAADLEWADAIIFSVPTRFGNVPSQMKQFLDTMGGLWAQGKTVNKVVSAMASAQNPHGGQEATILSLYTSMYHWGAIVVAPGYTDQSLFAAGGNPYGVSVTAVEDGSVSDASIAAIQHQARRVVNVAKMIKNGQDK
ncbi:NAD(P)H:quinone oxidoreductase [Alicyclobacillus dauci]|uniref:NAD(P)H:quinone oxidoreductase n=1 Tax=Alicyclobacillus dauci TaxID=1475485 RepID=A0ABY6Z3Z9_9BACL|nr:NAD(P)H:quinone oxidoreductase [Alicyclobacillus dauci]WAH37576.1 NAD(P)H:quinone oxidoreductase [Alicyclobacillus dauci]